MAPSDYAFTKPSGYTVDHHKYGEHYAYDYLDFRYVPSLLDILRSTKGFNDSKGQKLWSKLVDGGNSKPVVSLYVTSYNPWSDGFKPVSFLVDTGACVSILTAKTADDLGIDRRRDAGEPIKIKSINGEKIPGLPRWIRVFLGGSFHPIPVFVPPAGCDISNSKDAQRRPNYLGRAGITSCFLMCFDNKRLYAFPRLHSEPGLAAGA